MSQKQIYGPLSLPSGKTICFREPNGGDRFDVLRNVEISTDNAISGSQLVASYIAAKCITKINDQDAVDGYKNTFTGWDLPDVDYYTAVFNKMFSLDSKKMENLDEVVTNLRNSSGSIASSM